MHNVGDVVLVRVVITEKIVNKLGTFYSIEPRNKEKCLFQSMRVEDADVEEAHDTAL